MADGRSMSWGRLAELARPEARLLAAAVGALLVSSGMALAYPAAIREIVDVVTSTGDRARLDAAVVLLVVMFLVQAVFGLLRAWLFTLAGERVVTRLRQQLYEAIIRQDIAFFDEVRTGELTNRLASDTAVLQNTVTVNISMLLRFTAQVIGGIGLLAWMSPTLTGLTMLIVPVVAVGATVFGRTIRGLSKEVQDALARSTEVAEESLSGVRTVRAFAAEGAEIARYGTANQHSYELAARRAFAYGAFQGVAGFAGYVAIAIVVWYGGRMVIDGAMTFGDLTAFLLYTLMVAMSLGALAGLWGDFMRAFGASERVFELIDRRPSIEGPKGEALGAVEGRVELDAVRFRYPARPDVDVLRGVSLRVSPGEVVAVCGPSGAGKSTIASMLLRFYDPDAGVVRLDGRDLRELDPDAVRRHIGIVSQEPILFATSIADNIRYGRPEATDAEVEAAARAANADVFIRAFPDGYGTLVGERGVRLSGGQKQRVAIARALLKDPRILVLDEATSALDAENEHLVQEALDRLMRGRTTIVIAHRLSTIQGADRVVVLDGGEVVEEGSHAELVRRDGLYRRLVERQFAAA
ncbi:MAG TPA: ABC transporter transmembrane domain-containing protein [Myxococcota bacterium]|nr:ABC transporter transmembrane domain-containing protein [Myxococcota bacterium]